MDFNCYWRVVFDLILIFVFNWVERAKNCMGERDTFSGMTIWKWWYSSENCPSYKSQCAARQTHSTVRQRARKMVVEHILTISSSGDKICCSIRDDLVVDISTVIDYLSCWTQNQLQLPNVDGKLPLVMLMVMITLLMVVAMTDLMV